MGGAWPQPGPEPPLYSLASSRVSLTPALHTPQTPGFRATGSLRVRIASCSSSASSRPVGFRGHEGSRLSSHPGKTGQLPAPPAPLCPRRLSSLQACFFLCLSVCFFLCSLPAPHPHRTQDALPTPWAPSWARWLGGSDPCASSAPPPTPPRPSMLRPALWLSFLSSCSRPPSLGSRLRCAQGPALHLACPPTSPDLHSESRWFTCLLDSSSVSSSTGPRINESSLPWSLCPLRLCALLSRGLPHSLPCPQISWQQNPDVPASRPRRPPRPPPPIPPHSSVCRARSTHTHTHLHTPTHSRRLRGQRRSE